MIPVRPEELSALLDGELDPARAREVRAQLETSPALRSEFEALSVADSAWRVAAGASAFTPRVELPAPREKEADAGTTVWLLPAVAMAISILILLRIMLKLTGSDAWMVGLPAVSLTLLLIGVVWLVRTESRVASNAPGFS